MARQPVLRAGTNPGGTPAIGGASAEAFGASVGAGISAIEGSVQNLKAAQKQRARELEAADAAVRMAEMVGNQDVFIQEQRQIAEAGGRGHTKKITDWFDSDEKEFLESIQDDRVREIYTQRLAERRARILAQEDGWERGQSVAYRVQQVDRTGTLLANNMATNPSPEGLEDALDQVETMAEAMSVVPEIRERVVREQQRKVAAAWGNSMMEENPAALEDVLKSGALNSYLEPGDIDALRDGAKVEVRRLEAVERARQAEIEAQAREKISLFLKRVSAGDQPTDAEFKEHEELAKQIGDSGRLFDVQVVKQELFINRETRDWTPQQFEMAIRDLRAKGDKRSTNENIRLKQLEAIASQRVSEFVDDPQKAAASGGNPAPAIDWADPTRKQFRDRANWARGFAKANGLVNVPYLSKEEMRPLKTRMGQGAAGMVEVATQLNKQWGVRVAGQIARQLAPGDRTMEILVGLPEVYAVNFQRGAEALKRNENFFDSADANEEFMEVQDAIPAGLRPAVFEVAKNLSAAAHDRAGQNSFDPDVFRIAIGMAMGGVGRGSNQRGGLGNWKGGNVWLPRSLSRADFERRMGTAKVEHFTAASVTESGAIRKFKPRYMGANGKPGRVVTTKELRNMELRTVSPGIYQAVGPLGGILVDSKGRPWQFDARKLPRKVGAGSFGELGPRE